ncbi:hypothetical protein [Actinoplanes derwentensis]|uniref:Uncharacterized protein n=1 Tax=Actinoplanes derwentensis TaxID=113562 RepID=A0A1H2DER6_9ACTN|nr:hypothetical protein [Actinoplanes derwentensis]GID84790.1 hypothetical protein Ade03nite_37140 [Actinoplanes derwentensis]SDT81087.1 hypothetical protein SAMN04489716_9489 [Actinoplanes derwentensis]
MAGWRWYLAVCAVGAVVHNLVPPGPAQAVIVSIVHFSGVAAIHLGVRRYRPATPPQDGMIGRWRLVSLAIAGLMAPLVLTIEWLPDDEQLDVPVVVGGSVLLFLLVMARLHGVVDLDGFKAPPTSRQP